MNPKKQPYQVFWRRDDGTHRLHHIRIIASDAADALAKASFYIPSDAVVISVVARENKEDKKK